MEIEHCTKREESDPMQPVDSATNNASTSVGTVQHSQTALHPITLSERSLVLLALVRIFGGLLWFQQLLWKMPPDFAGLHRYVIEEGQSTFLPGYAWLIQHLFLPNFLLLGAFTWSAELVVALCLLFGLFSRFGAILATLLSLQLYIGLAYAPGEWYWTYGMLVLLSLVLATVPTGRCLGVDQWLVERLNAQTTSLTRFLGWFV
jgi:thiosulfate dehydrogenase [quinone] large subunit